MGLLKLMIVDDEKIILRGLIETFSWEDMGFEVVDSASSGEEALDKVAICKPDVILTDIRMKKMDGLMLMQEIHKTMPDIKFVVLSAYKDFEYAQKACELGALSYLVKPISEEQLTQVFKNVYEVCVKEKEQLQNNEQWKRFISEDEDSYIQFILERYLQQTISIEQIIQLMQGVQKRLSETESYLFLRIDIDIMHKLETQSLFQPKRFTFFALLEEKLKERYSTWKFMNPDGSRSYLIKVGKNESTIRTKAIIQAVRDEMSVSLISAISNVHIGFEGMQRAYAECNQLYEIACEAGSGTLVEIEGIKIELVEPYSKEIENEMIGTLRKNDEERMKDCFIRFIYTLSADEDKKRAYLHQLAIRTELFFRETYGMTEEIEEGYQDFYNCIKKYNSMKLVDILYKILGMAIQVRKEMMPAEAGQFFSNYIQEACEYVKENLGNENLTISMVAEQIFLNPVYFGRVFKQVMQMSFKQYLMKERMEYAKQLLAEQQLSINDICIKVGIPNSSYFSKVFKQETGMLPSEYKRTY